MTAGLVFLGFRELDMVEIANRIINSFDMMDDSVTSVRILSDSCATVTTLHYYMRVAIFEDVAVAALDTTAERFLAVQIASGDNHHVAAGPAQDAVLASTLKSLHTFLAPDYVKWVGHDAILSRSEFSAATEELDAPLSTHLRNHAKSTKGDDYLPPVDETNKMLQQRLASRQAVGDVHFGRASGLAAQFLDPRCDELAEPEEIDDVREETPALRLSAWIISFTVALFALPVGVTLIIINLFKGENLRLNAQAAALTGTFISLQASGATAQALATVQGVLN